MSTRKSTKLYTSYTKKNEFHCTHDLIPNVFSILFSIFYLKKKSLCLRINCCGMSNRL